MKVIARIEYRIHLTNLLIITGGGKNVGKTYIACKIIKHFSRNFAISGFTISPHFYNNREMNKTMEYDFLVEMEMKTKTGKDSSKMLLDGANEVFM